MEEEARSLRRSSRSRSRTPSLSVAPAEGDRLQGMREATVRIERFQAIREVIIEGQNEVSLSSSSLSQTFTSNGDIGLNNNLSLEAQQNAINVSQEKKKRTSKTAEEKSRRTTKSSTRKSAANGGTPAKKKSNKSQNEQSEISQEESVASTTTKSQTKSRTTTRNVPGTPVLSLDAYRSTRSSPKASPQARRLYEEAMSGQFETDKSVFLSFYRNIGEWWNYYKKTDYTYSPLSQQRYEIAPGVYNMPNLSRRPVGTYLSSVTRSQQNFNYNLSREDSDTEEYVDPRRAGYYQEEEAQQFSLWRRVSRTVVTFFLLLYTYTFGALVNGVSYLANRIKSSFTAVRNTNETETRSYYYFKETLITENSAAEEVTTWKQKMAAFFLWVYGGLSRNWGKLLGLLLLLLLAYAVYTAGWCSYVTDLYEKSSILQDCSNLMHNTGTWIVDALSAFWERTTQLIVEPWNWLISFFTAFGNIILTVIATPFQAAMYVFGWISTVSSSFVSKLREPLFPLAEMKGGYMPEQEKDGARVQNANQGPVFGNNIDIEELALKVLGTSAFRNLQNKQAAFTDDIKSQTVVFQKMSEDISGLNEKLVFLSSDVGVSSEKDEEKSQLLASIEGKIGNMEEELKQQYALIAESPDCCDQMQAEIGLLQGKIDTLSLGQPDQGKETADITASIQSQTDLTEKLRDRIQQLEVELKAAQEKILASIDEKMEAAAREMAELKQLKVTTATHIGTEWDTSDEKLIAMIRNQIAAFDADKTSLPDYALESAGGTILTTRCTESYNDRNAITYYLGLDWLYKREYHPNSPRSIIQPSVNPGDCYAFKGATGIILIELSKTIHLTAVTMEHIPKSISLDGTIDSAPKDFSIWGFREDQDFDPLQLGSFTYLDNGEALQTFEISVEHDYYKKVELRIESNHGHMGYTCIYRFRVHGKPL